MPSEEPPTTMIIIDCPLCDGAATTDAALTAIDCDGCGVRLDVAPDRDDASLDLAA